MDKPKITTIVVIICIIILGLYAAGEVNYYSSKIAIEKNIDSPVVNIPTIGIEEKINNVSLSQGVMMMQNHLHRQMEMLYCQDTELFRDHHF